MPECTSEYKDNMFPTGRALTSDRPANSSIIVVDEKCFKVQSEFSI